MFTNEITASAAIADLTVLLISVLLSALDLCSNSLQLHHAVLKKMVTNAINMTPAKTGVQ